MRSRAFLLSLFALLAACGPSEELFVGELSAAVVYGADDRLEVFNHGDAELQGIARESIVALIRSDRIIPGEDGLYGISAFSLKDERGLCDDELFANQPVAATCSGVLIDEDLVLTAGHCLNESRPCESFRYVFDYHLDGPNLLAPIEDEDVYSCNRVLLEEDARFGELTPDFALIQLDRPVEGAHSPVAIRPASPLEAQERISMIGFGSGLPAKIDSGARVAEPRATELDYFIVNLDAFEGHSGSATFDENNLLAGILVGGRVPDYALDAELDCYRTHVFDDVDAGEIVHNIAPIIAAVCDAGLGSEDLCEDDACDGEPCGQPSIPGSGGGAVPAGSSGCSAGASPSGPGSLWLGLFLFLIARRFRKRVA